MNNDGILQTRKIHDEVFILSKQIEIQLMELVVAKMV